MTKEASVVLRQAMELDETARAEVADALIRSLEPVAEEDVALAWRREVRRRVASLEAGTLETVPWTEVRDRLYARLRADRD